VSSWPLFLPEDLHRLDQRTRRRNQRREGGDGQHNPDDAQQDERVGRRDTIEHARQKAGECSGLRELHGLHRTREQPLCLLNFSGRANHGDTIARIESFRRTRIADHRLTAADRHN
jgi:hypothetical protein